ncbi:MAG: AAA family ATPase [Romboutsia sp.]
MKYTEQLLKDIPIEKKDTILNKMRTFEKILLESKSLVSIPKGFWIIKIAGTDVYKFRVSSGHRVLFKYKNKEIIFIRYCNHDQQTRDAKNYNNGSSIIELEFNLDIDKTVYEEDEIDLIINESINNEVYTKLSIIENELVIDDEYIGLSIDECTDEEMKFLSKEQYKCIANINKPTIVLGCAGSGKTMIAIRKLILNNDLNVKTAYITSSRMIVDKTRGIYSKFIKENDNVNFYTYREICNDILGFSDNIIIDYDDFHEWLTNYTSLLKGIAEINIREIWIEIKTLIKGGRDTLERDEYLYKSNSHYDLKTRNIVYKIATEYNIWLKRNSYYDDNDLAILAINKIKQDTRFDYVIYDEVQEMTRLQSELIIRLSNNINNVMLLGDLNQNINIERFDYDFIKDIIFKNGSILGEEFIYKNYRNSSQLIQWINRFKEIKNSKFKSLGKLYEEGEIAIKDGNKPRIIYSLNYEETFFKRIDNDTKSIVIVADKEDKEKLKEKGYPIGRIFSVEDIRGLEYDNVYCYNLMFKFKDIWDKVLLDTSKSPEINRIYFNMLYIAVTRSKYNICFIEDESTTIGEYLNEYWDRIYSEDDILSELIEVVDANKWLEEARKLEKSENYYQASEAYKKAGRVEDVDFCLRALARKISYKNNEENPSFIVIQSKCITRYEIIESLRELKTNYNATLQGYVDITVYYSHMSGARTERIYIYNGDNHEKVSNDIYEVVNKPIISKDRLIIKACLYNEGIPITLKADNKDILIDFLDKNLTSMSFYCEDMRIVSDVLKQVEEETLDNIGHNINNHATRLRNEKKYENKNVDDILDFILKGE